MTKDQLAWQLALCATVKPDLEEAKGNMTAELRLHDGTAQGYVIREVGHSINEVYRKVKVRLLKLPDSHGAWN